MAAAKIYWSVDTSTVGNPLYWLDQMGCKHREDKSGAAFEAEHPRAQWIKWNDFCKRAEQAEQERQKLARWNAGV